MVEALILLTVITAQDYAEMHYGQAYSNFEKNIEKYHIDDTAHVVDAYHNKRITFKWEF